MTLESYLQGLYQGSEPNRHADLVQLSGLTDEEMGQFRRIWPSIPADKRRLLMDRLVSVAEDNVELDFNAIFKHGLDDADAAVRARAISGLWECDDHNLVTPVINLLKKDPDQAVRASAATILGKFGALAQNGKLLSREGERIKNLLMSLLEKEDENLDVRRRVLEAVAIFNTPRVRELIQWAYKSAEPKLRISALYAMGRTGDPAWLPTLLKAFENGDPAVRYEAATACGELGEEEAVPYLASLVQDDDSQVQMAALRSMGVIGGPLANRFLKKCLKSSDQALQEAAEEVLQQLETEEDPLEFKF